MDPYKNFQISRDDRGIVTVSLDVPGRPMNVLTTEVLSELDRIVHELETSNGVRLVIFRSDKESGFLSGADVEALQRISTASETQRAVEMGQTLFQRIEWLPMPTVAVIHGPCLGGGLELALACDHRIARDNSSTKIGLPEIKLGLIPGWGGTQRLPQRVGLSNALSMILTGKHLSAHQAYRIGLIDQSIKPDAWDLGIDRFIDSVLSHRVSDPHRRRPIWQRWLESIAWGQRLTLHLATREVQSKIAHYPALASAIHAVRKGVLRSNHASRMDGYLAEREEFSRLLATPTCRHLLELFFAQQKARKLSTWASDPARTIHESPIRRVAVIGAGAMGAGIGQLAAVRGFDVVLKEIDEQAASAGRKRVEKLIDDLATRKRWSYEKRSEVSNRITVVWNDESLVDCDLAIEAVVERMDVKKSVFGQLDSITKPDCVLASNTSSLQVTEMSSATHREAMVAGLHFFNPVHRMELVEVVRADKTNDATIAKLIGFVKALGKTPVVTKDEPGFLVNRVLFPYLGEAVLMVGEGFDVAEIDRQVRRFGMPMGPLQLLDQVGIDVAHHVAQSLADTLPGVGAVAEKLAMLVQDGRLGRKAGMGFYHYHAGKRRSVAELTWPTTPTAQVDESEFRDDSMTDIQRRLIYPMVVETVRCHEQKIVDSAWAIDLAIVMGTGFAPHSGGPLHLIDQVGSRTFAHNLSVLEGCLGDRFAMPNELIELANLDGAYFGPSGNAQSRATSPS